MHITSSKTASRDGPKPGPLGDLGVMVTGPDASSGRGFASFVRPSSTHGVALAPTAPIRGAASIVFSCTDAPGADPSSKVTLEISTCPVLFGDEGGGDAGRGTNQQKFRVPNVLSY
jgi:hypothetical protein